MLAEAMTERTIAGPNPALKLSRWPEVIQGLRRYREKVMAPVDLGLGFE